MIIKKRGYSLLELTLVLGAISILIGFIFMAYNKQKQETQIRETTQQIDTDLNAAADILSTAKPDGTTQTQNPVSMQILKDSKSLPDNLGSYSK